jgi:hypothetical protein
MVSLLRLLFVSFVLSATEKVGAQVAHDESFVSRRGAIFGALLSRFKREGESIKVGRCSLLLASGLTDSVLSGASPEVASSFEGSSGILCTSRGGVRTTDPWTPVGEVASVTLKDTGGRPVGATVVLRVWHRPTSFADEIYDLVPAGGSSWTVTLYRRKCCSHLNGRGPQKAKQLLFVNGQLIPDEMQSSVLGGLSGQRVVSIRVIPPGDSSVAIFGLDAVGGVIVVDTRTPDKDR